MKLRLDVFGCRDTVKVRNDDMNCFAKFKKFLPHSIIMPSFKTVGSQMPELEGWGSLLDPHTNQVAKIPHAN